MDEFISENKTDKNETDESLFNEVEPLNMDSLQLSRDTEDDSTEEEAMPDLELASFDDEETEISPIEEPVLASKEANGREDIVVVTSGNLPELKDGDSGEFTLNQDELAVLGEETAETDMVITSGNLLELEDGDSGEFTLNQDELELPDSGPISAEGDATFTGGNIDFPNDSRTLELEEDVAGRSKNESRRPDGGY